MASMSSNVDIATRLNGGFFTALMRKIFGGESLFINEFKIDGTDNGSVVSPNRRQAISRWWSHNTALYLQPGAFVACDPTVDLSLGWAAWPALSVAKASSLEGERSRRVGLQATVASSRLT